MVRSLTTFIEKCSDIRLRQHKLHDCYLIIDAKNISFRLFLNRPEGTDCFGGDYDTYAHKITNLYNVLKRCNITPIIVIDGNNEEKKLNTNMDRYRDRVNKAAEYKAPEKFPPVYPLFLRHIFVDIAKDLGLYTYRCPWAADNDIAALAEALKCPVLSQDSDYFIYDVDYIPFESLNLTPKYTTFWHLNGKLYNCNMFLSTYQGLLWEHLPLMATILGGDNVPHNMFEAFLNRLCPIRNRMIKIKTLICWLGKKSIEGALLESLGTLTRSDRETALTNIYGYSTDDSIINHVLNIKLDSVLKPKHNECDLLPAKAIEKLDLSDFHLELKVAKQDSQMCFINDAATTIPTFFMLNNAKCCYSQPINEIATSIKCFLPAILDNINWKPAYSICFDIISAMNKIMSQTIKGIEKPLTVVCRSDISTKLVTYNLPVYEDAIISLGDIPTLAKDDNLKLIFKILKISAEHTDILNAIDSVPDDWKLLILSITYWLKFSINKITISHRYSLYLCAIIMKIVDKKIGTFRSCSEVQEAFNDELLNSENTSCIVKEMDPLKDMFSNITTAECASTMNVLAKSFDYSEELGFDREIIHIFAELQCCIYYISALNTLLDDPLEKVVVQNYFNSTFLYNTYLEIKESSDDVKYVEDLLEKCPIVLKTCKALELLFENLRKM